MRLSRAIRAALVAAAAASLLAACGRGSGHATVLGISGLANANASVAAQGLFVAVVWGAAPEQGAPDIYVATSRDAGATFGSPTRVNDDNSRASLSGEQPPRVALLPHSSQDPSIVVVWTARGDDGTRIFSARSDDGGRSFSTPKVVPGTAAPGNRGWESITAGRDGRLAAIWLDHRELAAAAAGATATAHPGHDHGARPAQQADSVARAQLSKLFFARLDDASGARELTSGVCYCCKTAIASGADGSVYAAWRHVYPGNIRDIAFTVSRDGGDTFAPPIRVSEDRWELDGCPENGPALAVDTRNRVHVVWPTLVPGATPGSEPTLALFYAMSADGRQFTPRQRIPTEGVPRHAQIALGSGDSLVVSWDEQAGGDRHVAVGRAVADATGSVRFTRQVMNDTAPAVYPAMATTDQGVVMAWTSGRTGESRLLFTRLAD